MSLRVVIVPDKFKGTLSAASAAEALCGGWRRARRSDRMRLLPMSDGGDGFGEILSGLCQAKQCRARAVNAAHQPCQAAWWWVPSTATAIIESSRACGLAMLPPGVFHPFELDTFGLGQLLRAAAERGARRCVVGLGGSATNDGGFGMARTLGWRFLDKQARAIERWTELRSLSAVVPPTAPCNFEQVTVAVDVGNPLLGARGASRIYGPQKGLRPPDLAPAELCLKRLAEVVRRQFGKDFAGAPGAGAAGGLGFGLSAFLDAQLASGFELFARYSKLEEHVRSADVVLTGEGAVDRSTLMGKGVGRVAELCGALRVPCLALAGSVSPEVRRSRLFSRCLGLTEITSLAEAKKHPALWLGKLAEKAATEYAPAGLKPGKRPRVGNHR